ncbi:MAG: hypothetical protein U1G07_07295 [Verrucomicrobiota bacterium]
MERYVKQLLEDIASAAENVAWPYHENGYDLEAWMPDHEEEQTAPRVSLEEWTGIYKHQLPPVERLNDDQVHRLLEMLKNLLDACNWVFVLQTNVPERVQYATIQENFNQEAKIKRWHLGFFQLCAPGTTHGTCTLGEHCQCRFYAELLGGFMDEKLSPEEERARELEWEISHLKRKYGVEWTKYYPYHLDPAYDDGDGNPCDHGRGEEDQEDDDSDWRSHS